ncbi:hypothetical protein EVC24_090 [Rhizobium phage RHph_I4]|nr:hypothetical protein EVC24_090 [Rhizobium phage RHph_I4]
MSLSADHKWSLNRAGIGAAYHDKSLMTDFGPEGIFLASWVQDSRAKVRAGHSVMMTGLRSRELMMMVARGFHLNQMGVYVTPLVRIGQVLFDAETREQVKENEILVITGFQQEGECPLKSSLLYETEHLINDRSDRGKTTFVTVPIGDERQPFDPESFETWWWSMELVDTILDRYEILDMSSRVRT